MEVKFIESRFSAILIAFTLAISPALHAEDAAQVRGRYLPVSIVRVLATPADYDEKMVSISGVLGRGVSDDYVIYLDSGSASVGVSKNGLSLRVGSTANSMYKLDSHIGKYVLVLGQLNAEHQFQKMYGGVISDVKSIRAYPLLRDSE